MKKIILSLAMFMALGLSVSAQSATQTSAQASVQDAPQFSDSKTYAMRFEKFVDSVAACDTLTSAQKEKTAATYRAYLNEYKVVKDSLTDEDVRAYSKCKVKYQKAMANIFVKKTSADVADTAEEVGSKVSKFFKKTKKKVQGAIDGFKEN